MTVGLAMVAGGALGAAAIHTLHAQPAPGLFCWRPRRRYAVARPPLAIRAIARGRPQRGQLDAHCGPRLNRSFVSATLTWPSIVATSCGPRSANSCPPACAADAGKGRGPTLDHRLISSSATKMEWAVGSTLSAAGLQDGPSPVTSSKRSIGFAASPLLPTMARASIDPAFALYSSASIERREKIGLAASPVAANSEHSSARSRNKLAVNAVSAVLRSCRVMGYRRQNSTALQGDDTLWHHCSSGRAAKQCRLDLLRHFNQMPVSRFELSISDCGGQLPVVR
jgi:hypothetical protein